ncbi:MAG TPA: efflux RND transporter periplasmic adaptor subunit, partial [Desulfobacteraceae bacterium]|nr:efflux RND transporter periplasmic adaptor subunit [Desulfobacteraceae bacterium]
MDKKIESRIAREKSSKRKKYLIIIAVLLVLVVSTSLLKRFDLMPGGKKPHTQGQTDDGRRDERMPVVGYKISRVNFEDNLNVLGNVEGGVQVTLHFEKEGRIAKINYRPGDFVKKGSVIATLETKEAELKKEQARIEYDQHKKLFEAGIIIHSKLEQARVGYEQARVEYEKMILYAPFDGVVSNIEQKAGEVVNPSRRIVSLFDTQTMIIKIGITENDINKLFMDQTAMVNFDAIPNSSYSGKVVNIDPNIDETTRMMTLKVAVDNSDSLILPGMFARVRISIYNEENALVLPSTALLKEDRKYTAFVIGEGNVVSPRNVEVSYISSDYATISRGIVDGEIIAVDRIDRLKEGTVVELLNVEEYTTHTPGKQI